MIRTQWIRVFGPLTMVAALMGCSTSTAPENEKDDVASEQEGVKDETDAVKKTPDGAEKGKRDHHDLAGMRGGPVQILKHALDSMDLSADQKATIDKAFTDAKPDMPEAKGEAFKGFFAEVAKEIRANSIDEAGLVAKAAGLEKPAADPMRASMAKTLQVVHDTLTPEQRVKLATDLEGKLGAMHRMDGKGMDGKAIEGKGREGKRGLGMLLRGVDVSDEQKDAIEKALSTAGLDKPMDEAKKGGEEMEAKMKALLEAFKGDKFDALALMPSPPAMKGDHLETMIKSLKVVVPLLDEAQRNELADRVEKGMEMKGKHGPRGQKSGKHGKHEQHEQFD
jgi:Spy/CpxP family protein refolding chaperone